MPPRAFEAFPLKSPVLAASGCAPVAELLTDRSLGAVVTPSYLYRARPGPRSVVQETPSGTLFRPALGGPGIGPALRRQAHAWAATTCPVVVSLLVDEHGGYVEAATQLEGVRGAAALELNLAWGAADGLIAEDPPLVRQTLRRVGQVCRLPLLVKLPYDLADPEAALEACATEGAAGVVVGAGVPTGDGMLLGPATFPLVLELVRRLARDAPLPVIACGGVATAGQARAYLEAGASAVQVGSAHLANPRAAVDIAEELAALRR
ncbi:MAG TPA: nitronate monooxygenase [Chloroflexota bacterium]|nr:nitronate monooxygenase [Chloroflexota bacterium]